jgi:hypothetical protein
VDATAARTYRITGLQPYVMLLVLAAATAFAPFVLGHAISTRSWSELIWVAVVVWFWCSTIWRAAYRIDVTADTVEFRSILWRRAIPLSRLRSIRGRGSGFAVVRFRGGRVDLYGTVNGWDEFVTRVTAANRHVRLIGAPADQASARRNVKTA